METLGSDRLISRYIIWQKNLNKLIKIKINIYKLHDGKEIVYKSMKIKNLLIIVATALFAVMATEAFSQEKGKWRFEVDIFNLEYNRYVVETPGFSGIFIPTGLNIGYNLKNNMNIGIKGESVHFHVDWNITGNYSYFFGSKSKSNMIPFIGGGIGYYKY